MKITENIFANNYLGIIELHFVSVSAVADGWWWRWILQSFYEVLFEAL